MAGDASNLTNQFAIFPLTVQVHNNTSFNDFALTHWSLVPDGTKPLHEPILTKPMMQYWISRLQWVNDSSLHKAPAYDRERGDLRGFLFFPKVPLIWHQICIIYKWHFHSLFMPYDIKYLACCLPAPTSHYLNQCWLTINRVFWYSHDNTFSGSIQDINS